MAIIGAGASGLAMGKYARDYGAEPVIFERSNAVAGVWKFDQHGADAGQPAYAALRTNSSRKVMEFAHHPMTVADEFPARADVENYLASYGDAHGLSSCIRYGADVVEVKRTPEGRWSVLTSASNRPEYFDHVVVCSGLYKMPALPPLYGKLGGDVEVTHSAVFRCAKRYAGKRVLVAGLGNSGADIAVELHREGAEVAVSSPRGAWVVPKYVGGVPYDYHLTNMTLRQSIPWTDAAFEALVLKEHEGNGVDIARFRNTLASKPLDLMRSRLTFNSDIALMIDDGTIRAMAAGEMIEGNKFRDTSGRGFKFDAVIAATGYQRHFPFLEAAYLPHERNVLTLYKHVFHPTMPGLAFLGMCGVVGAIFPVVELQAQWVASCFLGASTLPSPAEMARHVETHNQTAMANQIKPSRVVQVSYMEMLAHELGFGSLEERRNRLPAGAAPVVADLYVAVSHRESGAQEKHIHG